MPRAPKRRRYMEEDLDSTSEAQGLLGAQGPEAEGEEATSFPFCYRSPSPSSPSFFSSSPSPSSPSFCCCPRSPSSPSSSSSSSSPSSSSSSSSFCCCLVSNYKKLLSDVFGTPRTLQFPQSTYFPPNVTAVTPSTQLRQGCSSPEEKGSGTSQALPDTSPEEKGSGTSQALPDTSPEEKGSGTSQALPDTGLLLKDAIDDMAATLVGFLLQRYRARDLTTKAEMLSSITKQYQEHFPQIFSQASECLKLVFGVDMKEVDSMNHADSMNHTYVLVNTLGLTYNGTLSEEHSIPKAGLLINILGVIFMRGDSVPEEDIWEALSLMGVYPGREHFIYGEPRKLITQVWVQEQYLVYRRMPNSVPARYEFLWGLRARAETSKMKILELLAEVNNTIPKAFPIWYEDALRDEEERSKARVVVKVNDVARAYCTSTFNTFSCLESETDFSLSV